MRAPKVLLPKRERWNARIFSVGLAATPVGAADCSRVLSTIAMLPLSYVAFEFTGAERGFPPGVVDADGCVAVGVFKANGSGLRVCRKW